MTATTYNLCEEGLARSSTAALPFAIGFYFAFRIMIVVLAVRLLGTDARAGAGINLAFNFFFLILVAFCSLGEIQYPLRRMARLASVRWVFIFLAVSGCSLSWTVAASLPAAIAYWCAMAADVAIVILLLRAGPLTDAAYSLLKGYVWGACGVAAIAWIMPAQSDLRLGDEEFLGPNQIGYVCAFAFLLAQYLMLKKDGRWRIPALLLAVTVLRSLSKTTILAFLICECFMLIKDRSMSRKTKLWLFMAAGLVIVAFSSLLAAYFDAYTNTGNESETLTGRLGIWAYFLGEAMQQPWIGHGFHSVWKVIPPFGSDQFEARHAHNELLQQFYAYGALGVCLFAGIYGSFFRQVRRLELGRVKTFLFALLIFVLVRGLADTEAFDLSLPLWTITLFGILVERECAASRGAMACLPRDRIDLAEAATNPAGAR
ncbi:MAG: O-antigen ligase family protein [Terracidiphilus sp.]